MVTYVGKVASECGSLIKENFLSLFSVLHFHLACCRMFLIVNTACSFLMVFSIFWLALQTQTATLFDQKRQPLHLVTIPDFLCWWWSFLYPCRLRCQMTNWTQCNPSHLHLHSVQLTAANYISLFLVKWRAVCPTEITWTCSFCTSATALLLF